MSNSEQGTRFDNLKISVVIPVYNAFVSLRNTVESVVRQTYKNIEVLLVDDGSTDGSSQLCDELSEGDNRIRTIHVMNGGVSKARNIGIENATGDYILFVDSDDLIHSELIMDNLTAAVKHNAEIVIFGFTYEYTNGRIVENSTENFCGNVKSFVDERYCNLLRNEYLNPPWNKLVKMSVLKDNNIRFNESYSICEDMIFSIDVLNAVKTIVVNGNCYYRYVLGRAGSLVNRYNDKFFEALCLYRKKTGAFLDEQHADEPMRREISTYVLERSIAYIKKISICNQMSITNRMKKLREIIDSDVLQTDLNKADLHGKKKIIGGLIRKKRVFLVYITYTVSNVFSIIRRK